MTERVAKRNLFVLFILLAVLAGMQLKNKAVHEWGRDFDMLLSDLKDEIGFITTIITVPAPKIFQNLKRGNRSLIHLRKNANLLETETFIG